MGLQLGQDPWILIALTFLEIFLILVPAFIASKIEKSSIKEEIIGMGFEKGNDTTLSLVFKSTTGVALGFTFFFIGGYILFFFKQVIVGSLFGSSFVQAGEESAINTSPLNPDPIQIVILILLQAIIVAPCEEGFFRGFIIKKTEQKLTTSWAIIIASICFTFFHVPPFIVTIETIISFFGYYFLFGILLALLFVLFKYSLLPCSIAHALFNILIILLA